MAPGALRSKVLTSGRRGLHCANRKQTVRREDGRQCMTASIHVLNELEFGMSIKVDSQRPKEVDRKRFDI